MARFQKFWFHYFVFPGKFSKPLDYRQNLSIPGRILVPKKSAVSLETAPLRVDTSLTSPAPQPLGHAHLLSYCSRFIWPGSLISAHVPFQWNSKLSQKWTRSFPHSSVIFLSTIMYSCNAFSEFWMVFEGIVFPQLLWNIHSFYFHAVVSLITCPN